MHIQKEFIKTFQNFVRFKLQKHDTAYLCNKKNMK